jgi:hypothetical protein
MPRGSVYYAIIAFVVVATLVPSFLIAWTRGPYRPVLAYFAGLAGGVGVLVAETYLANGVWWDEVFEVLLLPSVGMLAGTAAGAARRSKQPVLSIALLIAALVPVAGAFYVVTMCALSQHAYVDVPFEAGNKGAVAEAEFTIATPKTYTFYLNLYFREGDQDRVPARKINLTQQELKSLERVRQNAERVRKLAGTGAYRDGRQIDTGLAIPVRLRVERIGNNGASSILERVFTNHDREGMAADYFSKIITRIRLEPGRYRARVEAMENIRELEGISVHFNMLVAYDRGGP